MLERITHKKLLYLKSENGSEDGGLERHSAANK